MKKLGEKEVRTIDENGEQLGIIPTSEALKKLKKKELDLVMIAPTGKPPVCKIMNYGKFIYEQTKKDKEAKRNKAQGY